MTLRSFRNPEEPGPHARTIMFGTTALAPGETASIDLPRLTQFDHDGNVVGEVDQQCPHLLEEINAPAGLVFEVGVTPAPAEAPVVAPPAPAPQPEPASAED